MSGGKSQPASATRTSQPADVVSVPAGRVRAKTEMYDHFLSVNPARKPTAWGQTIDHGGGDGIGEESSTWSFGPLFTTEDEYE